MTSMEDNLTTSVKTAHAFILWPSNHNSKNFSYIYYFTHVKWHMYKVIYCNTVIAKSILKIWVILYFNLFHVFLIHWTMALWDINGLCWRLVSVNYGKSGIILVLVAIAMAYWFKRHLLHYTVLWVCQDQKLP